MENVKHTEKWKGQYSSEQLYITQLDLDSVTILLLVWGQGRDADMIDALEMHQSLSVAFGSLSFNLVVGKL